MKFFWCQGLGHYAYECTNKKAMILRNGEYISESEVEKGEQSEDDEEEVEKTPEGELLMIRRLLGVIPNFVWGPLLDDMQLLFDPYKVLGTHH